MRDLARLVEMYVRGHPRAQLTRRAYQLRADFNSSAGRIDYRADHRDPRGMLLVRHADGSDRKFRARLYFTRKLFRQSEFHFHWRRCSYPEQFVVLRDFLSRADVAARDHAIERRNNAHLF